MQVFDEVRRDSCAIIGDQGLFQRHLMRRLALRGLLTVEDCKAQTG